MNKKIIIAIILLILVSCGLAYLVMSKKEESKIKNYECTVQQKDTENYTLYDIISFTIEEDALLSSTYKQKYVIKTKEAFDNFNKEAPKHENYIDRVDVDSNEMTVIYYRKPYYKYDGSGIKNYIEKVESFGYKCVKN